LTPGMSGVTGDPKFDNITFHDYLAGVQRFADQAGPGRTCDYILIAAFPMPTCARASSGLSSRSRCLFPTLVSGALQSGRASGPRRSGSRFRPRPARVGTASG
jgi:hypothetical protein